MAKGQNVQPLTKKEQREIAEWAAGFIEDINQAIKHQPNGCVLGDRSDNGNRSESEQDDATPGQF